MKTVIVDSDGLVALLYARDVHAPAAEQILHRLIAWQARLLYPATVLIETATLFQLRLKQPQLAGQVATLISESNLEVTPVGPELLREALTVFRPQEGSKHHTLFDAVVAATAQMYQADTIFSFDGWYQVQGFTLAQAFLTETQPSG